MRKLEQMQALTNQVKIYVPSTVEVNKELPYTALQHYINNTLSLLSGLFGGATATEATGAWLSDVMGLVREKVNIVYAYADSLTDEAIDQILEYCETLKSELNQEAIALEVNNKLYFV